MQSYFKHSPRGGLALLRLLPFMVLAGLAACSRPDIGPNFTEDARRMNPATFECCFEPEKFYPAPLIHIVLGVANELGPAASQAAYGDFEETEYPGGLTGKTEAHDAIVARLKPLDILLTNNASYTIGRLMPGRFSHALIYLGSEAQLRAAGLWHLPELAPHRADIRAGKVFLEAVSPQVQLETAGRVFQVDRVAAFRPALSAVDKRQAIRLLMPTIGKSFNYRLGLDPDEETFACTALAEYAMPALGLNIRQIYTERAVLPDDVAAQAIRGDRLTPVTYVVGDGDGYSQRSTYAMMVDIAAYWGVPGAD